MAHRKRKRLRPALATVVVVLGATGVIAVSQGAASAATRVTHIFGYYGDNNFGLRYSSPAAPLAGQYVLQSDFWNSAVAGPDIPTAHQGEQTCDAGGFDLNWDTSTPSFWVNNNNANSYVIDGIEPGCGNNQFKGPNGTGTHIPCNNDSGDFSCNWVGTGNPWVNPKIPPVGIAQQVFADTMGTTGNLAPWLPQPDPDTVPQASAEQHANIGLHTEFGKQIHAPASYPSLFLGCHWGNCSPGDGAPFPMQLSGLAAMPVVWDIDTTQARKRGDVWDASLDIWLDTNTRGAVPANDGSLPGAAHPAHPASPLPDHPLDLNDPGQNDGAEIMIWNNSSGYQTGSMGQIISPVGHLIFNGVKFTGIDGHWDVWAGRARSFDNGVRWNVISFVNLDHSDNFHSPASFLNKGPIGADGSQEGGVDIKPFLDFASSLGAQCTTDIPFQYPTPQETRVCVEQNWWLTSVQAGFEIWHLDSAGQLKANTFSVSPIGFGNQPHVNPVHTDPVGAQYTDVTSNTLRKVAGHRPVVAENGLYVVHAAGCPNGTDASAWLSTNRSNVDNADFGASQPMTESPPGSGNYVGAQTLGLENGTRAAGAGGVLFRVNCPDGTQWAGNGGIYASDIADVMWLHKPSGTLLEWQIDREANTVATPTLAWTCNPDCQAQWRVVGSGDLNGDDRADLLWYNASTGQLGPWLIGTASPYSVSGPVLNRTRVSNTNDPWRVVGVGDFNDDGYNDVLWHNVKTGVVQEWFLDGADNVTGERNVDWTCSTACSNSWLAVGVGDFNADGHVDILWRDRDDDLTGTWNLDAAGHVLASPLLPQCNCPATWEVGVGDANGDGFPDLYWFNPASGVVTTWLLDQNGNRVSVHTLNSTCAPGCSDEWEPVAVNEFNLQGQVPND